MASCSGRAGLQCSEHAALQFYNLPMPPKNSSPMPQIKTPSNPSATAPTPPAAGDPGQHGAAAVRHAVRGLRPAGGLRAARAGGAVRWRRARLGRCRRRPSAYGGVGAAHCLPSLLHAAHPLGGWLAPAVSCGSTLAQAVVASRGLPCSWHVLRPRFSQRLAEPLAVGVLPAGCAALRCAPLCPLSTHPARPAAPSSWSMQRWRAWAWCLFWRV